MKLLLSQIRANSWNCNHMGETEHEALKQRLITQNPNTIDPLIIRLTPEGIYEIVDGEHRWKIAQELGWNEIEVFVIDIADDLEAKARCISNSKLRGHVNWIKLAKIIKQDFETGVNLTEAYKNILSEKEIEELFSLDTLVPKARLDLEEAVKKFPTIPLYDLHMIAQFPTHLQEQIAQEYKTYPIASHALARTLNKYTKHTQHTNTPTTNNPHQLLSEEEKNQTNNLPEKLVNPLSPNDILRKLNIQKQQQCEANHQKPTQPNPTNRLDNGSDGNSSETALSNDSKFHALLLEAGFCCDCGHVYRVQLKDRVQLKSVDFLVQNKHRIFEHIELNPRIFLVHCDNCNSDQEIRVNNTDDSMESVAIFCRQCNPTREGVLDIITGDAVWFG